MKPKIIRRCFDCRHIQDKGIVCEKCNSKALVWGALDKKGKIGTDKIATEKNNGDGSSCLQNVVERRGVGEGIA